MAVISELNSVAYIAKLQLSTEQIIDGYKEINNVIVCLKLLGIALSLMFLV